MRASHFCRSSSSEALAVFVSSRSRCALVKAASTSLFEAIASFSASNAPARGNRSLPRLVRRLVRRCASGDSACYSTVEWPCLAVVLIDSTRGVCEQERYKPVTRLLRARYMIVTRSSSTGAGPAGAAERYATVNSCYC